MKAKPLIKLEKFEFGDTTRLISWIHDADFLLQWAGPQYSFPLTAEQIGITYQSTQGKQPKTFMYKALDTETKAVVGHVELIKVNHTAKTATLGRVLIGPESLRKKGHGREMVDAVLKIAFNQLKLEEVELGVYSFNKSAQSLYEKLGFKPYKDVTYKTDSPSRFHHIVRMKLDKASWNSDLA